MRRREVEKEVGIKTYRSKTPGIGGKIKEKYEDFLVEEILPSRRVLKKDNLPSLKKDAGDSGDQTHAILQKRNYSTMRAIKRVADHLRVSRKRVGYAGTKDKRAVSTQRISIWNVSPSSCDFDLKDLSVKNPVSSDSRINLGDLYGNRFTVCIRGVDLSRKEAGERVASIADELKTGFPNFFGLQRFGKQRPITHLVGKAIIRDDLEKAVMIYLAKSFPDESEGAQRARDELAETRDFKKALRCFPKRLGYEKAMLNHLVKREDDFYGALKQLPRGLRIMFVHAYQSYIFNNALSMYLKKGIPVERLPLVGYDSGVDEASELILREENVSQSDFKSRYPEFSSAGTMRDAVVFFDEFHILDTGGVDGCVDVVLRFSLPKGCYATCLLREFMKS